VICYGTGHQEEKKIWQKIKNGKTMKRKQREETSSFVLNRTEYEKRLGGGG
jgi:hypothetical protein